MDTGGAQAGDVGNEGGAGAGGAGGEAGEDSGGALAISNLQIDPNPNMTISCFVSWTTQVPASSEVDFGEGGYAFRIRDATPVTDHHVLVIGMHAETTYKLVAISSTGMKSAAAEGTFTTGALPETLALPVVTSSDPENSQAGWTLTNISVSGHPAIIAIYDQDGLPVWYFVQGTNPDTRGDIAAEFLGSSVLVGPASGEPAREVDLSGAVVWEGPAHAMPAIETHHIGKTSTGNYLINTDYWVTVNNARWIDAFVQELEPDYTEAWSWHLFDHWAPTGTRGDICHGNSMTLDEENDVLYYNCRFLGILKIDRTTGNILWRLGGSYDTTTFGPGDFTFDPPESQFSDAHDPEFHADGTVLLYDNGGFNNHASGEYHTRIIEYHVDQVTKTATRTFEFPGDFDVDAWYKNDWYSPIFGDADRLANGNILIAAGLSDSTQTTRIFEVTRAGEVVWKMTMPTGSTSYRAQRISPPPLVEPLP